MTRESSHFLTRQFTAILVVAGLVAPLSILAASLDQELHVEGTRLTRRDGQRFIVRGVNLECFRDKGCGFVTTGQYRKRTQIVQKIKGLGFNAVRFNYRRAWLEEAPENLNQLLDFMQVCAESNLYIMPSDHSYTGKKLDAHSQSYGSFQAIIAGVRQRGIEAWLMMNPYNEPGPCSRASWVTNMQDTLVFLRGPATFRGVVVVDTPSWATEHDPPGMIQVREQDANLLGGRPKVVFAHHWYPNHALDKVRRSANSASTLPLITGEIGQINPGTTGVDSQHTREALNLIVKEGVPNGHNGVFAWIWNWCDQNSMTETDYLTLNGYGQLITSALSPGSKALGTR